MSVKFFKKLSPGTPVVLQPGNIRLDFTTLDGLLGYYATDKTNVQEFLVQCITEQRFGLSEISEQEFHADYVTPKKNGARPQKPGDWQREQIGGKGYEPGRNPIARFGPDKVQSAVSVSKTDVPMEEPIRPVAPAIVNGPKPIEPNVGKRKAAGKPKD